MARFIQNVITIGIIKDCIGIEFQWKEELHIDEEDMKCKRCKKEKDIYKGYTICVDCVIELDQDYKDINKWKINYKN